MLPAAWIAATKLPQGAAEIVPVQSMVVEGQRILYVMFQRQRFEVDEQAQALLELDCKVNEPLASYASSHGHASPASLAAAQQRFGSNSLVIPVPLFKDIFAKQMLGPVPVFQVGGLIGCVRARARS